ncbi:olfactory receptor 13H1-like [Dasypus novemcinctus]|uniref:olfactory receptor 13H1-like n=1 Tax=Dasypus novemcinctus TaxID=9361 RepID=UPI0039C8EC99
MIEKQMEVAVSYSVSLLGNSLILLLICCDPRFHTPMYFFLSNLSFLNMCCTSSSMPQVLTNILVSNSAISLEQCLIQMAAGLYLGIVECLLLAAIAYNHCVAIGDPCANLCLYESLLVGTNALILLVPSAFIVASYGQILATMLWMWSLESRVKAFSTCGYHLRVVTLFYSSAISIYMTPQDKTILDREKVTSTSYGALMPMLNPLIYSLRIEDMKGPSGGSWGERLACRRWH